MQGGLTVFTIGHSTRPLEELIGLLRKQDITELVDVRTIPRSLHNPQYQQATLADLLPERGIRYTHMPGLGGLRKAQADSVNTAWRNRSFRGFADYMQAPDFGGNLQALLRLAGRRRIAIMCAEALPWRCHRSLIADALVARQVEVEHIFGPRQIQPHALTAWARVTENSVSYPASEIVRPASRPH